MLANEHLFEGIGRILHDVEPVSHLYSLRRSLAHAVRIRSRPITADDINAGMVDQPVCQRLGAAVGQEIDEVVALQVGEDGSIGPATSETPVIHAQHLRGRRGREHRLSHQSQYAIATDSSVAQPELLEQAVTGLATEREADAFELATQQWRASLIDGSHGGQAFAKGAATTGGVATVKTPCA